MWPVGDSKILYYKILTGKIIIGFSSYVTISFFLEIKLKISHSFYSNINYGSKVLMTLFSFIFLFTKRDCYTTSLGIVSTYHKIIDHCYFLTFLHIISRDI